MKKTYLILSFPVVLLIVLLQLDVLSVPYDERPPVHVDEAGLNYVEAKPLPSVAQKKKVEQPANYNSQYNNKQTDIIDYALSLLGSPYKYGGITKDGFDCSGFITHVFDQNGVPVKRSSALQATEGVKVDRDEAAPGDLVIFTGTDKSKREPGHVGIVISEPGDTIEFVHSSSSRSDGGVKISKVEGSGYDERFLEVRRVL